MNTLTLIKKQIEKAAALHDAQIAMTTYRGVKFECKQGVDEVHGTFCYRGHTYNKWIMEALKVAGFGTLFSIVFITMIYGEVLLLTKK